MTKKFFGKILLAITSLLIIATGVCFIAAAAHIFFTGGDTPYSRERVGEYLYYLALPSLITAAFALLGAVFIRKGSSADKIADSETALSRLSAQLDVETIPEASVSSLRSFKKKRRTVKIISFMFSICAFAFAVLYVIFAAKFTTETLNEDVLSALSVALPLSGLAIFSLMLSAVYCERSAKMELEFIRSMISGGAKLNKRAATSLNRGSIFHTIARIGVLAVSIGLIAFGVMGGGMTDVLAKAVKICTECIGLG